MRMNPMPGKVILFLTKEPESQSKTGIILVNRDREDGFRSGTVIAVGGPRTTPNGAKIPSEISVGEKVLILRYAGMSFPPEVVGYDGPVEQGDEIRLVLDDDILLIIE